MYRKIAEHSSIRVAGHGVFKTGQEEQLHALLTEGEAREHVRSGRLEGDWSGAQGRAAIQREETRDAMAARVESTPLGRHFRNQAESTAGQRTRTAGQPGSDDEPDRDGEYAKPIQMRPKGGGWFNFYDADDEIVLGANKKPLQIQGETQAKSKLDELNK